ncbi:hypothetical protein HK102_006766, partial [Quaeritorhiza haematococci]
MDTSPPTDLLIIGSGPNALALLALLYEPTSSKDTYLETPSNPFLFNSRNTNAPGGERVVTPKRGGREVTARKSGAEILNTLFRTSKSSVEKDNEKGFRIGDGAGELSIRVVDKMGGWMRLWDAYFEALGIRHLRSPVNHHISGVDPSALLVYAKSRRRRRRHRDCMGSDAAAGRTRRKRGGGVVNTDTVAMDGDNEEQGGDVGENLFEIGVNDTLKRDKTFHGPFLAPSTKVFERFCKECVVERMGVGGVVERGEVVDIRVAGCGRCDVVEDETGGVGGGRPEEQGTSATNNACTVYEVALASGERIRARSVVLAVGSSCLPNIPDWVPPRGMYPPHALVHQLDIALDVHNLSETQPPCLRNHTSAPPTSPHTYNPLTLPSLHNRTLTIIGGGLTAGHLSLLALNRLQASSVHVLTRRPIRVQPFDVTTEWFGIDRPRRMTRFWNERDLEGRARMLREARGGDGSSITPEVWERMGQEGVVVEEGVEVVDAVWEAGVEEGEGQWRLTLSNGEEMTSDVI